VFGDSIIPQQETIFQEEKAGPNCMLSAAVGVRAGSGWPMAAAISGTRFMFCAVSRQPVDRHETGQRKWQDKRKTGIDWSLNARCRLIFTHILV